MLATYALVAPFRSEKDYALQNLCRWYVDKSLSLRFIKHFFEVNSCHKEEYPRTMAFLADLAGSEEEESHRELLSFFEKNDSRLSFGSALPQVVVGGVLVSIVTYYLWQYFYDKDTRPTPYITD